MSTRVCTALESMGRPLRTEDRPLRTAHWGPPTEDYHLTAPELRLHQRTKPVGAWGPADWSGTRSRGHCLHLEPGPELTHILPFVLHQCFHSCCRCFFFFISSVYHSMENLQPVIVKTPATFHILLESNLRNQGNNQKGPLVWVQQQLLWKQTHCSKGRQSAANNLNLMEERLLFWWFSGSNCLYRL